MARRALTGSRIRRIRLDRGMRQAHVARDCGISSSYLNLIEHNRRAIGGALLGRIAEVLGVDVSELSEGVEAAVTEALEAAAGSGNVRPGSTEPADDFAGRYPGWARLVRTQHRRILELERLAETLNDRLTHDPYLSASLHNVLSTVTAIRSTSGILTSGEDIEPEWQARFHRNIYEDSQRLADAAQSLVSYLDSAADAQRTSVLPQDDLESWLVRQDWSFGDLEDGGTADPERLISASEDLTTDAARRLAGHFLARYAADAAALPNHRLMAALDAGSTDPWRLANDCEVAPDLVMRRLAAMPKSAFVGGLSPGLVICDASGTLTFRKPVRGFEPPRYGAACPLWPLYRALQAPGTPIREHVVVAGRDEVHFLAHAIAKLSYPGGFDGPGIAEATMLLVPLLHPSERHGPARPMGATCRICAVSDCVARREPSLLGTAHASGTNDGGF